VQQWDADISLQLLSILHSNAKEMLGLATQLVIDLKATDGSAIWNLHSYMTPLADRKKMDATSNAQLSLDSVRPTSFSVFSFTSTIPGR